MSHNLCDIIGQSYFLHTLFSFYIFVPAKPAPKRVQDVFLDCPCYIGCPAGCSDCYHWACEDNCANPDENNETEKVRSKVPRIHVSKVF